MLEGDVRRLENDLRIGFSRSDQVAVEGNTAFTHPELIDRLACEFAVTAYQAVYDLFGVDAPVPVAEVEVELAVAEAEGEGPSPEAGTGEEVAGEV